MKFVTIRDFRSKSGKIQKELPKQKEMIITSNGKPIAILCAVSEENLEKSLKAIRRARVTRTTVSMQMASYKAGRNKMKLAEINKEIAAVRKDRRKP